MMSCKAIELVHFNSFIDFIQSTDYETNRPPNGLLIENRLLWKESKKQLAAIKQKNEMVSKVM